MHDDPRLPAVERLAMSRERLRGALLEIAPPPGTQEREPSVLMTALMGIPGVNVVVDAVRGWWAQHPLHLATLVAGSTANSAMGPMARRSPYTLVLAAAAVGALVYWVKPWRGLLRPALLAGLVPHLVARAMDHVPVESWMTAVSTFIHERMGARGAASDDAAEPASPAAPSQTGFADPVATPPAAGAATSPLSPAAASHRGNGAAQAAPTHAAATPSSPHPTSDHPVPRPPTGTLH